MRNIKTIGIIGAGTMGAALAQKFIQEGFDVILHDRNIRLVEKGIENIFSSLDEGVSRKVFTPARVREFLSRLDGTIDLNTLKNCDLVIEAIFEDFKAKVDLFKTLDEIVRRDC